MVHVKPNILIFMTDQQRGDTIPPYGKALTPNLDQFSKEGLVFSNAYTSSPHCCPSRATFFTGLYPSQHGVWNNVGVGNALSRGLYEGVRLWSEDLRDAGYDMYFHGKWHVSDLEEPSDRGFIGDETEQESKVYKHVMPDPYEWEKYIKRHKSEARREGEIAREGYPPYVHYGTKENPFNDSGVVSQALEVMKSRSKGKPWCHYVGTLGPHDPYFVPQKYLDMYKLEDIQLPHSFTDRMEDKPALYRKTRERFDQLSEQEHKEAIRHYLAFCTYEDALFGELLKQLDKSGEADNTLVIYLSDHGDYMAEHGLWCKGLPCFKGAYHIPLAMRWPKGITQPGRLEEEFVMLADFAPTFLELTGIPSDRQFTGASLIPFLNNKQPKSWRDAIFTQSNGNELYGIQRSIITREWKYVYNGFDYEELYNLQADPNETQNLFGKPEYDQVVGALSKRIWTFAYSVSDVCINPYIMVGLAPYGPGVAFEDTND
jgi:arylsulfatase A-like enzyme